MKQGAAYDLLLFVKARQACVLTAALEYGELCLAEGTIAVAESEAWQACRLTLTAREEAENAVFLLSCDRCAELLLGYTSLLPQETYMGHGLRSDIVAALRDSHPAFLRFPGGCVVEGVSREEAMRLSETIGPAWERPSRQLMWHYRTTNGFGYHEFLQLCEDLHMAAMYVVNCGITCQARVAEYLDQAGVQDILEEALGALEYALGPAESPWGAKRAQAGHPAPFPLKYLEIGNENFGPEYNERYLLFYRVIKAAYPYVRLISNTHTELFDCPTELVDEHYYNTPAFFLDNTHLFDERDRGGPGIFLGEYAVNGGKTVASMECALAEAAFLTGVERNQDVVRMTAYAPMLEQAGYAAWKPNLIVFDHQRVYGIPTYHMISMFAAHRGDEVIETAVDAPDAPGIMSGLPGLRCEAPGLRLRNARINGRPMSVTRAVYGAWEEHDGETALMPGGEPHHFTGKDPVWNEAFEAFIKSRRNPADPSDDELMWVLFGRTPMRPGDTFEVELCYDGRSPIELSLWNECIMTEAGCNEPRDASWHQGAIRNQFWRIENGEGVTDRKFFLDYMKPEPVRTPVPVIPGQYNAFRLETDERGVRGYVNGTRCMEIIFPKWPEIFAAASVTREEVILKLVHTGERDTSADILLDCDVLPDVSVTMMAAPPEAINSFEQPRHVSPRQYVFSAGGRRFSYPLAAHSIHVLRMQRPSADLD